MTTAQQWASNDQPERSWAWVALVLGILGLAFLGVFAPFAWAMGNGELAGIDAGRRSPANRATAVAARVLGIVGTVIMLLAATLFTLALVGVIEVS